jgi:hypothetical protein
VLLRGDERLFWDRTLGYQSGRGSPFSLWGLWDLPHSAQVGWQVAAIALALVVAFFPRVRDVRVVSALAAAVMIAFELGITHWFYLYLVWFFPLVMVALTAPSGTAARSPRPVVASRTPVPARP